MLNDFWNLCLDLMIGGITLVVLTFCYHFVVWSFRDYTDLNLSRNKDDAE